MNRHERMQRLLLFPEELTSRQRAAVEAHARGCARCLEATRMIEMNQMALGSITRERAPQLSVESIKRTARPAPRPRLLSRTRAFAAGGLATAAAAIAVIVVLLGGHSATPASAYALLQRAAQADSAPYPYSGMASISYAQIPWYLLPPKVADYAGRHRLTTRWWVKDATHFRVEMDVMGPPLERGTITGVLNGNMLTIYDARTRRATVLRGSAYRRFFLSPEEVLALLQNGSVLGGDSGGQAPVVSGSVSAYLASLRAARAQPGIHPYARIVRQTRMLGQRVDVVEYGPLTVLSYDSGGCYPTTSAAPHATPVTLPPAGPCNHYRQAVGWARVWITPDHPLVLRFEEHGLNHVHNVLESGIHFRYQVTALRLGRGPSAAALAYAPPVRPVPVSIKRFQAGLVGTQQTGSDVTLPGFLHVADPPPWRLDNTRLATTFYGEEPLQATNVGPPPWPFIPGMDVLFSQVRKWVKVYTSWHGQASIYVTGPYVLVQERKLAGRLPANFTRGTVAEAGMCRVWIGRYWDGQRWAAFERSGVSVVLSTNALSTSELLSYAAQSFCR